MGEIDQRDLVKGHELKKRLDLLCIPPLFLPPADLSILSILSNLPYSRLPLLLAREAILFIFFFIRLPHLIEYTRQLQAIIKNKKCD